MFDFISNNVHELLALLGVALVGVGIGLHDLGAGLAVAGALLIGLVIFAVWKAL